jgi:hypothetical protein
VRLCVRPEPFAGRLCLSRRPRDILLQHREIDNQRRGRNFVLMQGPDFLCS